jgi:hypothetical protein
MNYKELQKNTSEKFQSKIFIPGDRFSEMLSYWVVVIKNTDGFLTTLEGSHSNLKLGKYQSEEFANRFKYLHIDGYSIDYMGYDPQKVGIYIDTYCEQQKMSDSEIRDFKLDIIL